MLGLTIRRLGFAELDDAAAVHRAAFDNRLPWLADLHTSEEDRSYFRELVLGSIPWQTLGGFPGAASGAPSNSGNASQRLGELMAQKTSTEWSIITNPKPLRLGRDVLLSVPAWSLRPENDRAHFASAIPHNRPMN